MNEGTNIHADHGNTGIHGLLQRGWSWPRHPLRLAALAGTGIMWACTKWVVVSQPFGSEEQKVHHRAHAGFTHHPRRGLRRAEGDLETGIIEGRPTPIHRGLAAFATLALSLRGAGKTWPSLCSSRPQKVRESGGDPRRD